MAEHAVVPTGLNLENGVYDFLRQLVEKGFPGLGVLYAVLAGYWHWGYTVEVVGSLAAIAVFGGLLLSLARKGYTVESAPVKYDGKVVEDVNEAGQPVLRLQLDPAAAGDLLNKDQIVFKGFDGSA